jgi:hypothetical protein
MIRVRYTSSTLGIAQNATNTGFQIERMDQLDDGFSNVDFLSLVRIGAHKAPT